MGFAKDEINGVLVCRPPHAGIHVHCGKTADVPHQPLLTSSAPAFPRFHSWIRQCPLPGLCPTQCLSQPTLWWEEARQHTDHPRFFPAISAVHQISQRTLVPKSRPENSEERSGFWVIPLCLLPHGSIGHTAYYTAPVSDGQSLL